MNSIDSQEVGSDAVRSGLVEVGYDRGEAMNVVDRLSAADRVRPVPDSFDPTRSYGQTRTLFETEFEQRYVAWLLARHSGNISAAAREARMDRKHLHDLAKKHGLRGRGIASKR
jgi:DNA-binding NtrC family response regulator